MPCKPERGSRREATEAERKQPGLPGRWIRPLRSGVVKETTRVAGERRFQIVRILGEPRMPSLTSRELFGDGLAVWLDVHTDEIGEMPKVEYMAQGH